MCGILIGYAPGCCDKYYNDLKKGIKKLYHRGPDNTGEYIDDNIYMGHTRLSILDIDESSNQPFIYKDLIMVFNGEIFNYLEIKEELQGKGYVFNTHSDTEVLIKAYHYYGYDCFSRFNGMWALAIYNKKTKELIVSRDRYGQKPLFICSHDGNIFIASEIQAIIEIIDVKPNYAAIESFIKEGDFDVNGNTFFIDVFEFPKAMNIKFDSLRNHNCTNYWEYPLEINENLNSEDSFNEILEDAVKIRLRSDVDYSLLLSGGCDSTIISGITRKIVGYKAKLSAFTYSSGDINDESIFAKEVAKRLSIDINISKQEKSPEEFLLRLKKIVKHLGRGHGSPAIISIDYLYGDLKSNGFKVALDGQGADELLAGYKQYYFYLIWELICCAEYKQILYNINNIKIKELINIAIMTIRNSASPFIKSIMRNVYGYNKMFSKNEKNKLQVHPYQKRKNYNNIQNGFNKYLIKQHDIGLANLLFYGDIVAMINSVENRSPFMDHRLIEMVYSSGFKMKVNNGKNKAVLRNNKIYHDFEDILERKKIGFESAISGNIKNHFLDELKNSEIFDWPFFNKKEILNLIEGKKLLEKKYERILFRLIQVHLWNQTFIKN